MTHHSIGRGERADEDPAGRRQRDEPRHALAAAAASGIRGRDGRRRQPGDRDGAGHRTGPHSDGHEPARGGRLGGHAADQSGSRHATHPDHRPHRPRHGRRPRASPGGRLRRLRHQADRPAAPAGEDRSGHLRRQRAVNADGGAADAADSAARGADESRRLRHELRTPLNHILGYGELLLEQAADDRAGDLVAPLEAICATAREALGLVNDLLDTANPSQEHAARAEALERLGHLLDDVDAGGAALQAQARAAGRADILPDLDRIADASARLRTLLHEGLSSEACPPEPRATTSEGGPAPAAATTRSAPPAPQTAEGTLLLVDDSEPNRDMLARRLERLGYHVLLAEDGRQALDVLAATPIDLVLLDVMMPVMDGYEVLARRRADPRLRDVPFIVISALDELASVVRCIEMGAEDYLPKPFEPVLLRARIGASLEKKRLRDQERQNLATIERQAAELAEWNRTLEARVEEQVRELERLARLRRFLSPQVAEVIVSSVDERVLESHRRAVTVVFTDLRGFTPFAGA